MGRSSKSNTRAKKNRKNAKHLVLGATSDSTSGATIAPPPKKQEGSPLNGRAPLNAADLLKGIAPGSPALSSNGATASNGSNGAAPSSSPPKSAERIDAVKDLLFGEDIGELREAMEILERQLTDRLDAHRKHVHTAAETEGRRMRSEIDRLGQEIRRESEKRSESSQQTNKRIDELTSNVDERLKSHAAATQQAADALRKETREHLAKICKENREAQRKLKESIDRELGTIRAQFTRREDLGQMFTELGKRFQAGGKNSPGGATD